MVTKYIIYSTPGVHVQANSCLFIRHSKEVRDGSSIRHGVDPDKHTLCYFLTVLSVLYTPGRGKDVLRKLMLHSWQG